MEDDSKPEERFENNPLAQAILREGRLIQERFAAEPVYAKTGKCYLKSIGVEEIAAAKNTSKNMDHELPKVAGGSFMGAGGLAKLAIVQWQARPSRPASDGHAECRDLWQSS